MVLEIASLLQYYIAPVNSGRRLQEKVQYPILQLMLLTFISLRSSIKLNYVCSGTILRCARYHQISSPPSSVSEYLSLLISMFGCIKISWSYHCNKSKSIALSSRCHGHDGPKKEDSIVQYSYLLVFNLDCSS